MSGFFQSITTTRRKNKLFLAIGGQSNAVGRDTGAPSEAYLNAVIPKTKIWTGSQFDPLQYPTNNGGINGHGIELNFGYLASFDYDEIYIVKEPKGNTFLADNGIATDNWSPNGNLYGEMITEVNQGLNSLSEETKEEMLFNFYWNQGENDASFLNYSNDYQANLQELIDNFRLDSVRGHDFKFICTRLPDLKVYASIVRTAQTNVVINTAQSHLINQDDFTLVDSVHFDSASQNLCAERVYNVV